MNRLVHIDFLKGLAIFLMIMGHVLSWSMADSGCPRTVDSWFVREVIYSFHMPLFMFMSGDVIDLKNKIWSWDICSKAVSSRLRSLLLPCFSFKVLGIIASVIVGGNIILNGEMPWFLRALFEIALLFTVLKWLLYKIRVVNRIVEIVCLMSGYGFIFILTHIFRTSAVDEWIGFTEFQIMYPYFICGYAFRKFETKLKGNWIYTLMVVIYALAFYYYQYAQLSSSIHSAIRYILALAGIFIVYHLAFTYCKSNSRIVSIFEYLGVHSIEIYLLSKFFIPRVPKIGQFIYETSLIPNEYLATSICLQNVIGIALSIYCVVCCLLVMKIIEKSQILALLFFGRKRQCS